MRNINEIIVHCADTPDEKDFTVKDIDRWHRERGWSGCGYHWVIRKDGIVEIGRNVETIGAHCQGHNKNSIGICLIGRNEFNSKQLMALRNLVNELKAKFPTAGIFGHYEFNKGKTCPNFNVKRWFYYGIFEKN